MAAVTRRNPHRYPGYSIHDELKWMVEAGLSPGEALLAATGRAAEMVGAAEDFGTVLDGQVLDRGRLLP